MKRKNRWGSHWLDRQTAAGLTLAALCSFHAEAKEGPLGLWRAVCKHFKMVNLNQVLNEIQKLGAHSGAYLPRGMCQIALITSLVRRSVTEMAAPTGRDGQSLGQGCQDLAGVCWRLNGKSLLQISAFIRNGGHHGVPMETSK